MKFNILYLTYALNGLLMIAMPIGLGLYLTRKFRYSWQYFWVGGAIFILSQVFHIPFNLVLSILFETGRIPKPAAEYRLVVSALILGLSAGFFEEYARYLMYRWWVKDARSWGKALLLGAGHGGIEAMILGILMLGSYIYLAVINKTTLTVMLPADQLDLALAQYTAYWSASWLDSLLGTVERLFALCVHVSLSVLVLQAFIKKRLFWLFVSIGWHAFVDAAAVYASRLWGAYATEAILGVYALASLIIIFSFRKPEPIPEVEILPLIQPPIFMPKQIEENEETINASRFQ